MNAKRIVIIGGGFGGLAAAQAMYRSTDSITLLDRNNTHLFQPLLYQVATGALSPGNIASPLRGILHKQHNVECLQTTVSDIDPINKQLTTQHGLLHYDKLIVATGMSINYFGHDDWRQHTYALKSNEDALMMRNDILSRFEEAAWCKNSEDQKHLLTFIIIGGGPTGIELAGTIADLAHRSLKNQYPYNTQITEILLLDRGPRILSNYSQRLSLRAMRDLNKLGVTVRCHSMATEITASRISWVEQGQQNHRDGAMVIWAAGVAAGAFGQQLAERLEQQTDNQGRIPVDAYCRVNTHPDVYIIGDLAHTPTQCSDDGNPVPAMAQSATQMGAYVGACMAGNRVKPFRYKNKGMMAIIGHRRAVAVIGHKEFDGSTAWILWLFIHIMQLVDFQNRLLVFTQWLAQYLYWRRSSRLILDEQQMAIAGSARKRHTKTETLLSD